jgi:hypothetical protein
MSSTTAEPPLEGRLQLVRNPPRNWRRIATDYAKGAAKITIGAGITYLATRYGPEFAHGFNSAFQVHDAVGFALRETIAWAPTIVGTGIGSGGIGDGVLDITNYRVQER